MERNVRIIILLAVIPLFCSCGHFKPIDKYKDTGFLNDYSRLKPSKSEPHAEIWCNPGFDLKNYNKIMLDPILVWDRGDENSRKINPEKLKTLTDDFCNAISSELGDVYPLVDQPGPDVLRVRIAITELVPAKPGVSVVVFVVPFIIWIDMALSTNSEGGAGSTSYIGYTAIESELLDSVSKDQQAAFVERSIQKKYNVSFKNGFFGGIYIYLRSYLYSYTEWSYTKMAFDNWAKLLRESLDEAHRVKIEKSKGSK